MLLTFYLIATEIRNFYSVYFRNTHNIQGGSNMTGTDLYKRTHKSVPVIYEPPCILLDMFLSSHCLYNIFVNVLKTIKDSI